MEINLVSDTVTKPSYEMLYMFNAKWVDDVYKQDLLLLNLESIGHVWHGSSFCFSVGTMANQTTLKLHTYGKSNIADKYAHVYLWRGGGASFNSDVSLLIDGKRGMITAEQVAGANVILSFITIH
jgi:threonine aldolase